jgi:hypothetical protein
MTTCRIGLLLGRQADDYTEHTLLHALHVLLRSVHIWRLQSCQLLLQVRMWYSEASAVQETYFRQVGTARHMRVRVGVDGNE